MRNAADTKPGRGAGSKFAKADTGTIYRLVGCSGDHDHVGLAPMRRLNRPRLPPIWNPAPMRRGFPFSPLETRSLTKHWPAAAGLLNRLRCSKAASAVATHGAALLNFCKSQLSSFLARICVVSGFSPRFDIFQASRPNSMPGFFWPRRSLIHQSVPPKLWCMTGRIRLRLNRV
jgi:hypothetical protein